MNHLVTPEQFLGEHWPLALLLPGVWAWISLCMIVTLWVRHRATAFHRKLVWTVILLIPAVGWILYLGLFRTPAPNKPGEAVTRSVPYTGHL